MSRYSSWLKRKENATPYANEAVCKKCKYGEWVRTSAFCTGRGRSKKIPDKVWFNTNASYCPEFVPKEEGR